MIKLIFIYLSLHLSRKEIKVGFLTDSMILSNFLSGLCIHQQTLLPFPPFPVSLCLTPALIQCKPRIRLHWKKQLYGFSLCLGTVFKLKVSPLVFHWAFTEWVCLCLAMYLANSTYQLVLEFALSLKTCLGITGLWWSHITVTEPLVLSLLSTVGLASPPAGLAAPLHSGEAA